MLLCPRHITSTPLQSDQDLRQSSKANALGSHRIDAVQINPTDLVKLLPRKLLNSRLEPLCRCRLPAKTPSGLPWRLPATASSCHGASRPPSPSTAATSHHCWTSCRLPAPNCSYVYNLDSAGWAMVDGSFDRPVDELLDGQPPQEWPRVVTRLEGRTD